MTFQIETKEYKKNFYSKLSTFWDKPPIKKLPIKGKTNNKLGSGAYAIVYESEFEDRVIKVENLYNSMRDSGYFEYIKALSKLEIDNPYFPKIFSATIYKYPDATFLVVEIEKLETMISPEWEYGSDDDYLCYRRTPCNETAHLLDFYEGIDNFKSIQKDYWCLQGNSELWDSLMFLKQTRTKLRRKCISSDIHAGNIMYRKDGTPVVIDPFA